MPWDRVCDADGIFCSCTPEFEVVPPPKHLYRKGLSEALHGRGTSDDGDASVEGKKCSTGGKSSTRRVLPHQLPQQKRMAASLSSSCLPFLDRPHSKQGTRAFGVHSPENQTPPPLVWSSSDFHRAQVAQLKSNLESRQQEWRASLAGMSTISPHTATPNHHQGTVNGSLSSTPERSLSGGLATTAFSPEEPPSAQPTLGPRKSSMLVVSSSALGPRNRSWANRGTQLFSTEEMRRKGLSPYLYRLYD